MLGATSEVKIVRWSVEVVEQSDDVVRRCRRSDVRESGTKRSESETG
jgi:hypothetical protein